MKTLRDGPSRQEILDRLARLSADTPRRWGRMHAGQMLCHVGDSLRMALGELKAASKGKRAFQVFPLKHLFLYVVPFHKGAPTAPELLSTQPGAFGNDRNRVQELVLRFGIGAQPDPRPEHPLLGALNRAEWGVLQYKHLDHHFRQFGV